MEGSRYGRLCVSNLRQACHGLAGMHGHMGPSEGPGGPLHQVQGTCELAVERPRVLLGMI